MARRQQKARAVDSEDENAEEFRQAEDTDYSDEEPESGPDDDGESPSNSDAESSSNSSKVPPFYLGKDKTTKWSTKFPDANKTEKRNAFTESAGVKRPAKGAKTEIEPWQLFFSDDIIQKIVDHTNVKLRVLRGNYQRPRSCSDIGVAEMKALFGLLHYTGTLKVAHTHTRDLWATDGTAPQIFRCVMSESHFCLLLRALRFDDAESRESRRKTYKLSPIREIWEEIVQKLKKMYCPGELITLDEMMFGFKGRCSFKQYLPLKPNSYGLKVFAVVDATAHYTCNAEIYLGKQTPGRHAVDNRPSAVVPRLTRPYLNGGRNITTENWFSSVPTVDDLKDNFDTTCVATLKKHKREIPPEFVTHKGRSVHSTLAGYNKGKVLISYVPKKSKTVLLLSSMHTSAAIDPASGAKTKPEIITFYNSKQGGVDTTDHLRSKYSVARYCCRWPLTVCFGIMDIVGINSQIVFAENTGVKVPRK
ncbi:piggyBac transposable element-derived protein 4-like [Diachasma alloeum]|uniref:piggyBac transposable element-derived protein 4-like n=1 Tax=Diachasma alloeum TaxID=454923 RepID=UPI0007383370|nr:piggyBac transposable element-derived protein 4-like [Diachasma alloeum]